MKKHWTFSKILRDVFFKTTVCFFNGFGVSKTNVLMVFKWCFNTYVSLLVVSLPFLVDKLNQMLDFLAV